MEFSAKPWDVSSGDYIDRNAKRVKQMKWFFLFMLTGTCLFAGVESPGTEFQINTSGTWDVWNPSAAVLTHGGFIVCWQSGDDIYGQRFDGSANKVGSEFRVNSSGFSRQIKPAVAALAGGGFVVCWESWVNINSEYDISGRLYDSSGDPLGPEFILNTTTEGTQEYQTVASLAGGGFVVCWESLVKQESRYCTFCQIFDAAGHMQGSEFRVNTEPPYWSSKPSVAGLPDGGFLVSWIRLQVTVRSDVMVQRFDASGRAQSGLVTVTPPPSRYAPAYQKIAVLSNAQYVVCWVNYDCMLLGQVFQMSGRKAGQPFILEIKGNVNLDTWKPTIASMPGGRFITGWDQQYKARSRRDLFGQFFSNTGGKIGGSFQINDSTLFSLANPSLASFTDGRIVACWHREDGNAIMGRLLRLPEVQELNAFQPEEPPNDASISETQVDFRWQRPNVDPEFYPWEVTFDLFIDVDPHFSEPYVFRNIADTSLHVDFFRRGLTYFWKVLARNFTGDSLWSAQENRGFRVLEAGPPEPTYLELRGFSLLKPTNGEEIYGWFSEFRWERASIDRFTYPPRLWYDLTVDTESDFRHPLVFSNLSDTTFPMGSLPRDREAVKTYYWSVEAHDMFGNRISPPSPNVIRLLPDLLNPEDPGTNPGTNSDLAGHFDLTSNFPNPFNSGTTVWYGIPIASSVNITIYDIRGRLVRTLLEGSMSSGAYSEYWDGRDQTGKSAPSGIYICRMKATASNGGKFSQSVKMGLVR
jgi:hypothetical protein